MRDSLSAAAYVYKHVYDSRYWYKRWRMWEWHLMTAKKKSQHRHVMSRSCQYLLSWMHGTIDGRSTCQRDAQKETIPRDGRSSCIASRRSSFNRRENAFSLITIMIPSHMAHTYQRLCILIITSIFKLMEYIRTMQSSLSLSFLFALWITHNSVVFAQGFPCAYDSGQIVRDLYTAYPDFIKTGSLTFLEVRHCVNKCQR